jgi:hypothetical protein
VPCGPRSRRRVDPPKGAAEDDSTLAWASAARGRIERGPQRLDVTALGCARRPPSPAGSACPRPCSASGTPLVRVERQRVGALDAGPQRTALGQHHRASRLPVRRSPHPSCQPHRDVPELRVEPAAACLAIR